MESGSPVARLTAGRGNTAVRATVLSESERRNRMRQDEKQKAEEIVKNRRLAAKGLKERSDGKPVDPWQMREA